jgi:hypothetical protein
MIVPENLPLSYTAQNTFLRGETADKMWDSLCARGCRSVSVSQAADELRSDFPEYAPKTLNLMVRAVLTCAVAAQGEPPCLCKQGKYFTFLDVEY